MSSLHHARQALEVVLNDEIRIAKLDASAALVLNIGHLIVRLPLDRVEPQVLSEVKEEAGVVSAEVEAG
jgi:hypothetical protein